MTCFREFFMELKVSKDIGLVKMKDSYYVIGMIKGENEMVRVILDNEINYRRRAEYHPKWKLYYKYNGYDSSGVLNSEGYPYIYQFIIVFSTGTLDEFSCPRACKLFLIILDCALTDVEFPLYSHLNYDVGSSLEFRIGEKIKDIQSNERHHKMAEEIFKEMLSSPCSNFNFINIDYKKEDNQYTTVKCFFSSEETRAVVEICNEKNVDIFAIFIAVINNNLFHYAIENGFKGIFRTRVLHAMNGRRILKKEDVQHKLGSYFLPYMQHFAMESTDVKDIFEEASKIELRMIEFIKLELFCDQEALREIIIKKSGDNYNSGKWNPNYCYSVTNMGKFGSYLSS
ncbi:hypothetical protein Anas_10307 [Armadillidium nasatum]|uniref:Uncharacterized protein n=1 Tax=Armadillidium nasatum TaxID=96803 RepID=A0A5N5TMP7_9CRUS|nr:hypothetical protein Anas_10307 [Armadillidium nasatum]